MIIKRPHDFTTICIIPFLLISVMKKKKSKPNPDGSAKKPSMDDFNILPGPDGFQKEDIERLGDPLEPEEEMISMGGDGHQGKEELWH